MKHVVASDLSDDDRLLALFEDAQQTGVVSGSEADRLRFIAAAERARTVGARNPCGLFVHLVRGKLWHFITQDDEDAGSQRLKKYLFGLEVGERVPEKPIMCFPKSELSLDARLVAAVTRVARQNRIDDGFFLLKRERPEWTRERWERAVVELEQIRFGSLRMEPAVAR